MRIASGGYRDFVVKVVPVIDADASVRNWVGTHGDITDRKRIDEFERERKHLCNALTAHERVLGVVGHELRTPLATTRAMTECLLVGDQPAHSPHEELVRSIHEQVVNMSTLLNDLLEVARMNNGTVRWNWGTVDLSRVCSDAIDTIQTMIVQLSFIARAATRIGRSPIALSFVLMEECAITQAMAFDHHFIHAGF